MNHPAKTSPHLSDEILRRIINDDQFDTQAAGVETHIDSCAECRDKLEAMAGNDDWLAPYRTSLSEEYHSVRSDQIRSNRLGNLGGSPKDFDQQAIEAMLSDLLTPSIHPETLGQLGQYEVESILGYGGMGVVLRAYDRTLQRPVAIKLIVPRIANDGTAKQRFTREARAAATVLHPNVIAIHCINETNGVPWFAMPLVAGPTLRELVEQNGPLAERDIVRIAIQIAGGLAAAHSHGLVHRDIKPANILVDNHVNRVVITDFGLARHDSDTMITRTGVLAGTLHYMSPEQTRGEDIDGRSDLFSLGSLLYYLASGSVPFDSESPMGTLHKIANDTHRDVRRLNPQISKTLASAIDLLLAKDRNERFQTASDLEQFLSRLIAHLNQPTQHGLPAVPVKRSVRSWLSWLVLPTVIAAVVFGIWHASNWLSEPASEPTMNSLWASIQDRYELGSPDAFDKEFSEFKRTVQRFENQLSEEMPQDDVRLQDDFFWVDSDLKALERQLK